MTDRRLMVAPELQRIHVALGIPADYAERCGMPPQDECTALVDVGADAFGRATALERRTARAWQAMQAAAREQGIELQLVSGFRSVVYQQQLFERKLQRGAALDDILRVNAAPGFSEHHSGRALDVGTPGYAHLEEEFEHSPAFAWLLRHAADFGFRLSFPRDNPFGVLYEPWHWYYSGTDLNQEDEGGTG